MLKKILAWIFIILVGVPFFFLGLVVLLRATVEWPLVSLVIIFIAVYFWSDQKARVIAKTQIVKGLVILKIPPVYEAISVFISKWNGVWGPMLMLTMVEHLYLKDLNFATKGWDFWWNVTDLFMALFFAFLLGSSTIAAYRAARKGELFWSKKSDKQTNAITQ